MKTKKGKTQSVFYDLYPPEKAAELEARSNLMSAITEEIKRQKLTQKSAAKILGVSQSRVSDMFNSRLSKFGLGMLHRMAIKIGLVVELKVKKKATGVKKGKPKAA